VSLPAESDDYAEVSEAQNGMYCLLHFTQANSLLFSDQQWLCDPSSIRFGESIGEGQFGDVFRGILNTDKVSIWCGSPAL